MEWYGKYWCVSVDELTRDDRTVSDRSDALGPILTRGNYDTLARRGKLNVVRRGGGKGCPALVDINSLPDDLKARVRAKYPDADSEAAHQHKLFASYYEYDHAARQYYIRTLTRLNQSISNDRVYELAEEYAINASVIQAVLRLRSETRQYRKVRNGKMVSWAEMSDAITYYKDKYKHTLGTTPSRFATRVKAWERNGYDSLISAKFGNSAARKVTKRVALILAGIDVGDDHRPYACVVADRFNEFLRGERVLFEENGMPIDRDSLRDEQGRLPFVTQATVRRYLKKGTNNLLRSYEHDDYNTYKSLHETYNNRKRPEYSLSKISLDDRDLLLKVRWSEQRIDRVTGEVEDVEELVSLKVYLAYDVASEAIVGYCFSGKKRLDVLQGCVQDLYRTLIAHNLPNPYEVEVENHLVSKLKDTSFKKGNLFPEVTWCAPENSQQKRAEHFNRLFKYSIEKDYIKGVGRHWSSYEAHRSGKWHGKSFDADNNKHRTAYYDYDEACAFYEYLFGKWNSALHPDQDRYKGLTRWQVLLQCTNPNLETIDPVSVARWAGKSVKTSISRNRVRVSGRLFDISSLEVLDKLTPRNNKVVAYWWEQEDSHIDQVYLYQDDRLIDICTEAEEYQEALAERTAKDWAILRKQTEQRKAQRDWIESNRIEKIGSMSAEQYQWVEGIQPKAAGVAQLARCEEEDDIDLSKYMDKDATRQLAIQAQ